MKRLFLVCTILVFSQLTFGQSRQAEQNLLQGFWLKVDSRGLNEYSTNFEFNRSKVKVAWDGDFYGEFNFIYENNTLKIYNSDPDDPFLQFFYFISDNNLVLLWDNGWAILEKR